MSIFLTCPCLRKKSLNSIFNVVCGMEGAHSRNHKVVEGGRTKMTIIQLSFMNSLATRHARSFLCAGSFLRIHVNSIFGVKIFHGHCQEKRYPKSIFWRILRSEGERLTCNFFSKQICALSLLSPSLHQANIADFYRLWNQHSKCP